ncbi:MAG: hypothetical protein GY855_04215 [candidate division Zixibacteria bacterium]|nr:hypothetical protein [candidate division Zixibacteria bacterium]
MFITLLVVTFIIALIVSFIISRLFRKPIEKILSRIISDDISAAWVKYLNFAIYVVGISAGVRIWKLEKYIMGTGGENEILELNMERWILELYGTVIGALQGIAWMLLVFFLFALIAYVIVRLFEAKKVSQ